VDLWQSVIISKRFRGQNVHMGFRYILLGLAIWGALLIIRHLIRVKRLKPQAKHPPSTVDSVQCAYCGLHLPKHEALHHGEHYFCNQEHYRLHGKDD
jgi:uncharacterized protein